MLILGRRTGDSIVIDGGIRIVVLACERGGVRLGIEAPPDIVILRGEIVSQVAETNRRASATSSAKAWVDSLLDGRARDAAARNGAPRNGPAQNGAAPDAPPHDGAAPAPEPGDDETAH